LNGLGAKEKKQKNENKTHTQKREKKTKEEAKPINKKGHNESKAPPTECC
jgi:hypothetical protein